MVDREEAERRCREWLAVQPWAADRGLVLHPFGEDGRTWSFSLTGPEGETSFGAPLLRVEKATGRVLNPSAAHAPPSEETSDLIWGCACLLVLAAVAAGVGYAAVF